MAGPHVLESFDDLDTAGLALLYEASGGAVVGAYGRGGTQGLAGGSVAAITPVVASFVMGFAIYLDLTAVAADTVVATVADPVGGVTHLSLVIHGDRSWSVQRGSGAGVGMYGGAALATSAVNKATLRTWMTVEWKGVIDPTTGTVTVRVNGETLFAPTGLDTSNVTSALSKVFVGHVNARIDDWWVCDQTGGYLDDFLGDRVVESDVPATGDGTYAEWTPATGTDHGAMVDDATAPDGDTTHNAAPTIGLRDTYAFPALTRVDAVDALLVDLTLAKDGPGTRAVALLTRTGGSDVLDTTDQYLPALYATTRVALPVNPDTTDPWSLAEANAAELGAQVTV